MDYAEIDSFIVSTNYDLDFKQFFASGCHYTRGHIQPRQSYIISRSFVSIRDMYCPVEHRGPKSIITFLA